MRRSPVSVAALGERCIREIGDWVPRGATVALLDGHDELARIVVHEKGCSLARPREATVLVVLEEASLREAAFVEPAAHASLAIVVADRRDETPPPAGWRVIDRKAVAAFTSAIFQPPAIRHLAEASRDWQAAPFPPVRWFFYRLHRVFASANRLESLALQALSGVDGAPVDPRQLLLLARSS